MGMVMNLKLILGGVLLLGVLIFAVQNAVVVDVNFLAWRFSTSLALVIFIALLTGWIIGWAITSARRRFTDKSRKS
jgi:lipopolysaccharide assembly protein A